MPSWKNENRIFPSSQSFLNQSRGAPAKSQCMIRIHIGGEWLNLDQVIESFRSPSDQQEARAIQLIKEWQSGAREFTFQTSGSTGTPGRKVFSREQLEASALLTERALKLKPGYTTLICLDVNFIAGAMMIIRSLVTKMNMIIRAPSSDPLHGMNEPVDFVALVPQQLHSILDRSPAMLDHLQTIIIGGAPLRTQLIEKLQQRTASFYATYGMTETLSHIALQKLNGSDRQTEFHPLPGINISTDNRGCLIIQAVHLGPDPVITNDVAEILGDDKFRIHGRIDQVINSGGIKIQPQKVEDIIQTVFYNLGIQVRFFLAGLPDDILGSRLVLVLEGSPHSHDEKEKILIALGNALDKYEIPRAFHYTPRFLITPTQKVDRIATLKILEIK